MSLGATWIEASDGMFYENPTFRGYQIGSDGGLLSYRWFLCFSDKEPPELVVEIPDDYELPPRERRSEPLHGIDLPCFARRGKWSRCGRRVFGVDGSKWDFGQACRCFGELVDPIRIPDKYERVASSPPLPGYRPPNELTVKLLSACRRAGYKYVSIGRLDGRIEACKNWPFDPAGSVFAGPKREDNFRPRLWKILERLGVAGSCGSVHRHEYVGDLTKGWYELDRMKLREMSHDIRAS